MPMSMPDPSLSGLASFPNLARIAARGNRLATLVSAFAFAFSAVSFYETVMKQPALTAYVPPVLHYGQDGVGDVEVFAIPVTIANEGARTGTVLTMTLDAVNVTTKVHQRFYSAYFGDHPKVADGTPRAFAPISIAGRSTFSDTIRFYPTGGTRPLVLEDAGNVEFTLTLETVKLSKNDVLGWFWRSLPQPLVFQRHLPWYSFQQLAFRRQSIAMKELSWSPLPEPAAATTAEPGESTPKK
jgi:hypothetical protein